MFNKKSTVENVQNAEIKKNYTVNGKDLLIRIQNGKTGIVDGNIVVLDEILVNGMLEQIVQAVKRNHSKYNLVPEEIILRNASYSKTDQKEETSNESKEISENSQNNIIERYEPRYELEQIALNNSVKQQIRTAISAVKNKKKMTDEWGMSEYFSGNRAIVLNFYGKPGTGKSMTAEAVAKALGKKVYHINYSELESKYVGETPKNIRKAFECATRDDAVLIFDEADSFLGKRLSSVTQSADYGVNITRSVLLMELEKFSGVVVFTTNLISNYDEAFKRRILLSVYFEMPDKDARNVIWKLHLGKKMPLEKKITTEELAARYEGISGADIKDMIFYAALYTLEHDKEELDMEIFDYSYKVIKERYENKNSESGFEIISTETISEEQYKKEMNIQEEIDG